MTAPIDHLLLVGCGNMGGAFVRRWLDQDVVGRLTIIDPNADTLARLQLTDDQAPRVTLVEDAADLDMSQAPRAIMLAVKPQIMADALRQVAPLTRSPVLVLSIAAGTSLTRLCAGLDVGAQMVRVMPNTPALVGQGASALIAAEGVAAEDKGLAERLMAAVGQVFWLDHEDQIDAVTGVSGSGPAYVFHLVEAMAAAGVAQGLKPDLAMALARQTVVGAGALMAGAPDRTAEALRVSVTSPNGTTQAALQVLMDQADGLTPLMARAIDAAVVRARELGA